MDSLNDFTNHSPSADPSEGDGGLDMDNLHDFGEGVGVDMRDFTQLDEDSKDDVLLPSVTINQPTPNGSTLNNPVVNVEDMFHAESGLDGDDGDDDDDDDGHPDAPTGKRRGNADVPGGFTYVDKEGEQGRRKIRIEYISDKSRRHITFSKRKAGIMKKAYELSILTGTQVLLLVVSETGLVYTFTTTKLQPLVQKSEGKNLIQACLNAPDGFGPDGQPLGGPVPATKAKNGGLAIRPHKLTAAASAAMAASAQAAQAAQQAQAEANNDMHNHLNSQQADAAAAVGQGTPVSARPKKRLPSGRKKMQSGEGIPPQPDHIPPVPSIPDIHRQNSPHNMMNHLASPLSAGYHMPPEYQQHQHHQQQHQHQPSPTAPTFGYQDPSAAYGYYSPQATMGNQYLNLSPGGMPNGNQNGGGPSQAQLQQSLAFQQQQDRERQRMMMAGQMG